MGVKHMGQAKGLGREDHNIIDVFDFLTNFVIFDEGIT